MKKEMESLFTELFPINRSITGDGVRESLKILQKYASFKVLEVPSNTKCFDWVVPKEWNIKDAYIKDSNGNRIVDFQKSNLHVVSYSTPINRKIKKDELLDHIYTNEKFPDAIPYRTSYYKERWGFCVKHNDLDKFIEDEYEVCIDSSLEDGSLSIGELLIKGKSDKEILISSYMCHPSMANNELSGPVAVTMLAKYLLEQKDLHYSYRIIIAPETIGSIVYLSQYLKEPQRKNVIAGYILSQVGIENDIIYKESREKSDPVNTIISHIAKNYMDIDIREYEPFGGCDQRQFCSLGINLAVGYIGRSLGGSYKEYHTSLDDLSIISYDKMQECIDFVIKIIEIYEMNHYYINTMPYCEPNLGKRGLYPTLGGEKASKELRNIMNILGYSDGKRSILEIADTMGTDILSLRSAIDKLVESGLLKI